ncbi:hypothetical protein MCOR25_007564 [Pyricularia grisea]|nr:hypothetical protein MCOR25_007564 [Pyricularia grisea]
MYAFNIFASLLAAAAIGSASPMEERGRESCCRNDPALLNDPTYKWSLECSSLYWENVTKMFDLRHCNLDPNYICKDECKDVPYLYPTPRDCPAKV